MVEFGCGQGRDSIYFARNGLDVCALDSSDVAVKQLNDVASKLRITNVSARQAELPKDLPKFARKEHVDVVYSNLFYCMPFTDPELHAIFSFVFDLLSERGLHIFSIRDKGTDKSYGKGKQIAMDTFEIEGFRVRFFSRSEILKFSHNFKIIRVVEAYEPPCSLLLIFASR
jgi:SAM-dependent methyltransferase